MLAIGAGGSAAEGQVDCTKLMAYGIYDKYNTMSTSQVAQHTLDWLNTLNQDDYNKVSNTSSGGSLTVDGLGSIGGNTKSSEQQTKNTLQTVSRMNEDDLKSNAALVASMSIISSQVTNLVAMCIQSQEVGLRAFASPFGDPLSGFDFEVWYKPSTVNGTLQISSFDVRPTVGSLSCTPGRKDFTDRKPVTSSGRAFSCVAVQQNQWPITIELNTTSTQGPIITHLNGPPPRADRKATVLVLDSLDGRYTGYVSRDSEFGYLIGPAPVSRGHMGPPVAGFAITRAPPGRYDMVVYYASSQSKPMNVYVNLPPRAPGAPCCTCPTPIEGQAGAVGCPEPDRTGGDLPENVQRFAVGTIELPQRDVNVLQFISCPPVMPPTSAAWYL